jgi:transposase
MYVGIDIGKYRHEASFLDHAGKELRSPFGFDNTEEGYQQFFQALSVTQDGHPVVVGMEATGHYWLNLFTVLLDKQIETHVVNPIQTEAVRRMNIRKTKTDSVDCRYIAQLMRIGEYSDVSVQSTDIAELKQLCRYRYGLVDSVSSLKNQVTGLMDRIFPEYSSLFSDIFGKASMELLKRYATPERMGRVSLKSLTEILSKFSRGSLGEEKAIQIKASCKHSVGICRDANDAFVFQLQLQLQQIEFMQGHIDLVESRIKECYSRFPCFLHTIKGVGVISAAVIFSEIGDIANFDHPKKLVAFAGIDPSVHQSGNFTASQSSMSKRGSPYLRHALWNAAESVSRSNSTFTAFYHKKREEGKNHMVAIGAVARKLCYVAFAILRDQTPFRPDFST